MNEQKDKINQTEDLNKETDVEKCRQKKHSLSKVLPYVTCACSIALLSTVINFNKTISENKKLIQVSRYVKENYYDESLSDKELEEIMIEGMLNNLPDNYSTYLNSKDAKEHKDNFKGMKTGIGISIVGNKIGDVLENSPASKQGLKKGDILTSINGINVLDMEDKKFQENLVKIYDSIAKNETNKIIVKRGDKTINYDIKKENYKTKIVEYKMLTDDIGLLKINIFSEAMKEDFNKAIELFKSKNAKGLIIDLRYNPGGEKDAVHYVADALMKNVVVGKINYAGTYEDEILETDSNALDIPMAVLTNEFSASSSEVLAGSIVANKKGVTIGTNTYGKGTVLGGVNFEDGTSMILSVGEIVLSNGNKLEGTGVKPYIEEDDESKQIDLAIDYLNSRIK